MLGAAPVAGAQTFAALSGVPTAGVFSVGASWPAVSGGAGAGIALLSGLTRIHRLSAGAVPAAGDAADPVRAEAAAGESDRRSGEAPAPSVASEAVRWAGGRVSAGRGPGRVLVACGVSRFVMVVPPR
ncbi:hypothetical protein AB0M19_04375 [Streptomyces sp. NPDC051920]|uniref:hypothetical protein n=1 Tax=Streptomyces sp. NPDC051920 TaxID=3155523 RepID=UPI003424660B